MARIERERSRTRSLSINATRSTRRRLSVSTFPRYPRGRNCSICLPVEIRMSVDIRSCDRGMSRVRGGMAVESPEQPEQPIAHETLSADEVKQPLPVLQEILKKQRAILRSLTGQKSLVDKLKADGDEKAIEECENKLSPKSIQHQHKKSEKPDDDSFSDGIKVNSNISFGDDDDEDKKRRRRSKRLKAGRNDLQLPTSLEGDLDVFPMGMEGGQMIELFNRQKVKENRIEVMSHRERRRSTSRTQNEESTEEIERKYENQRREYDRDSRKSRGNGSGGMKYNG